MGCLQVLQFAEKGIILPVADDGLRFDVVQVVMLAEFRPEKVYPIHSAK